MISKMQRNKRLKKGNEDRHFDFNEHQTKPQVQWVNPELRPILQLLEAILAELKKLNEKPQGTQ